MTFHASTGRERTTSAALSIGLTGLAGWALVAGLGVDVTRAVQRGLSTFTVLPDPPPPQREAPVPDPKPDPRPEGEAAPPNLVSQATPVTAPPPVVRVEVPSPVVVAPAPAIGLDPTQGAADRPGPGTGAGGAGDGTGSGGAGDGSGNGRAETPPRQIAGRIRPQEIASALGEASFQGTVSVWFDVEADGRVSDCGIDRSSGNPRYDALMCRLIRERFRYDPARDERGRPVPSTVIEDHSWEMDRRLIDRGTRRRF